jgi:bile acid:Na+ symporter, BASS family
MKTFVDITIPLITFLLMTAVGLDLTGADFARLRSRPRIVLVGLLGPLLFLPPLALALIAGLQPAPAIGAGLLLIAACPVGGISNTYTYLARASTALSVTLTGISCLLAIVTIPMLAVVFSGALGRNVGFAVPVGPLMTQLAFMLALPVGFGMFVRQRWPDVADRRRGSIQRLAFGALAILIVTVVVGQFDQFRGQLLDTLPIALLFVAVSGAVGWVASRLAGASTPDRLTLAVEFATRNVAIAAAIAVTILGDVRFAVFATTYFLIEMPVMLVVIAVYRRRRRAVA